MAHLPGTPSAQESSYFHGESCLTDHAWVQGNFCVFVGSKAVRFSRRDSRLVVETLRRPCGEAPTSPKPVEQLGLMASQGAGELLHWLDAGAHRHCRPRGEEPLRGPRCLVVPELLKHLLENVRLD